MLTTAEAAALLTERGWRTRNGTPISAAIVAQWIRQGNLPAEAQGIGNRATYYVRREDLDRFERPQPGRPRKHGRTDEKEQAE